MFAMRQANHPPRRLRFGLFEVDLRAGELTKRGLRIRLQEQPFQVLAMLLARPGELVTREELRARLWGQTVVDFDHGLNKAVNKIREALGDSADSPRFVETVARRGYRFLADVAPLDVAADKRPDSETSAVPGSPRRAAHFPEGVVGRDEAIAWMRGWLDKALGGERQTVFVSGEAGVGKTALVDAFIHGAASDRSIRVGRGQCLEHYGKAEAYLPVLEAVGRLCREESQLVDVLRAHAPTWLVQMPSLLNPSARESLSREVTGATRERMLREMGEALNALTSDLPLIVVLEDLHWSDYSTLDLISYLARQREPAKLMLIGTYRSVELALSGHPLKAVKQELLASQQCEELPLQYLGEDAVAKYLASRFSSNRFPAGLATLIHDRTEGNPLFMVNVVDYLVAEGSIVEHALHWDLAVELEKVEVGVPDSIKHMIEKQVDHLDAEDRRTLEAASVAGAEFSMVALAAGVQEDPAIVEARCDALARRRQFIEDCGVQELPSGDAVARYGFIHALYQNVLYDMVPPSRRVQLHRRIGEEMEQLYGERAGETAAELAMHFERGGSTEQAVKYLQQAARNDIRRFAYRGAVALARRGLELLSKLPDTPERERQELSLQLTLGVPLIATQGYAAPDVGAVYLRARELNQQLGDTSDVTEILWGLWTFHALRADLETARGIAEELLRRGERLPYPELAMRGHWALEITFMHMGEFALAIEHYEKALLLYDPRRHVNDGFLFALNPGVAMPCFVAWALWLRGQPDQALVRIQQALTLARELSEPLGLAHALLFAAVLHQFRREERLALENADAVIAVSSEHGLVLYRAMATVVRGWALFQQGRPEEAIEQIRQGLAALQATGTELVRPKWLGLLGEALSKSGQTEEGLLLLEEGLGLAQRSGERYFEAELYRIKGEMLLAHSAGRGASQAGAGRQAAADAESLLVAQAEGCFNQAIKIARQQHAKSWELRSAMSLARLHRGPEKRAEALGLLAGIYGGFTEGFATADLREAKTLLDGLSGEFRDPPSVDVRRVELADAGTPPKKPHRTRNWIGLGFGLVLALAASLYWMLHFQGPASPKIRSLAVLPLENLSGDASQDYFADGMTDALITDLAQISALRVISRTSVMTYKRVRKPLAEIARELNVEAVVEGTVSHSGERVRVTAQLIQVPDEKHLWAESYEGDLQDTLALQNHVARAIADRIQVTLNRREELALGKSKVVKPEAYEAYLKGRYFWNKRTGEDLRRAIEHFERAVAADPSFAVGFSGLADAYALSGDWEYGLLSPQDAFPRAKAAAIKALALDDNLGEAHTSLAFIHDLYDWDWESADKEYGRALALNPGYATAHQWYASHLMVLGRNSEAISELKKAERLDPLSLIISADLADVLCVARLFDESLQQSRRALALDPYFAVAHYLLGQALQQQRKHGEAIAEFRRAIELSGGNTTFESNLANAYAASGRKEEAMKIVKGLEAREGQNSSTGASIALIYVGLGDNDRAMIWLEKAYKARFNPSILMRPVFDPLRSDARFQDLLRRIGLPGGGRA